MGDLDEQAQICMNSNCSEVLFISGRMDQNSNARGIDRLIEFLRDSKGEYIQCPKCGAKHKVLFLSAPKGHGGLWKVIGLRNG